MINRNKLNRVKGILSAKHGAEIPKYEGGAKFLARRNKSMLFSNNQENWFFDQNLTQPYKGSVEGYDITMIGNSSSLNNTSSDMKFTSQDEIDKYVGKNKKNVEIAGAITKTFQTVGDAFGAQQSITDSNLTKGIDVAYNMAADMAGQFGPVGQFVGTAMKTASTAGNILQGLGGGTDQMTTTDKWMDSPLFSWWLGAANGFGGKKSENFGVDQNIVSQVGSSYGDSVSELNEAASKAGKKYGLFSAKARRRANAAIADARKTQSTMGNIADAANDDRMLVQSMGEQAGLNYSMMVDGGYNQKYTYSAKTGGVLRGNLERTLEWKPKIELNEDLLEYKSSNSVNFDETLEPVKKYQTGNKIVLAESLNTTENTPTGSSYFNIGNSEDISAYWDNEIQKSVVTRDNYFKSLNLIYPDDPIVRKKKKEEKARQEYQYARKDLLKSTDVALNLANLDINEKNFIIDWLTQTAEVRPDLVSPEFLENSKNKLNTVVKVTPEMLNLFIPEEILNTEEGKALQNQIDRNRVMYNRLNTSEDTSGSYTPNTHSYAIKKGANSGTIVHELAHIISPEIIEQVRSVMKKHGIQEDDYWNNPYEIYSRLMALRHRFRFDKSVSNPKKRDFTWNEIYDIIRLYSNYDVDSILKPNPKIGVDYSTAFILDLFNHVASNDLNTGINQDYGLNYNNPILYAANGGTLELLQEFKTGNKINLDEVRKYFKDYDLSNVEFIMDKSPRTEGNKLYISNDEDAVHELWHYLSDNQPNEKYKEFYNNLNDDRITELGGDLNFVKRHEGDPGHFYHPSELEARIMAAKFKSLGLTYTKDFFKNLRSDENKYGYNMRDLLHMYNDENLEKIFNLKKGGSLGKSDIPEIEETTQKNIIPEGALHKNKHHMEHADGLTKKGIPVIDEDGEQQAEIEHSEIIFTLEVTKKLEEYYDIFYSDESSNKEKEQAALDAGKLLVYQILENTEDRTGLIESCKEGGSLKLKKSTDDLIEEVLEWIPTIVIIELEEKSKKKSEKDQIKETIKEVLIELLTP